MNVRSVEVERLRDWATAVFARVGMRPDEAALGADVLSRTSLRGFDTHGLSRVPQYAESLIAGRINPQPVYNGDLQHGVLTLDCDRGLGQVAGAHALQRAVEIAQTVAFVPCLLRQCGHLGALGTYVLMAAESEMFGFLCQSARPSMAMPGWRKRAIGNNPLAFATPAPGRAPIVFDMASSVVAGGHLSYAARERIPIPEGWAIGRDGQSTTDPNSGAAGAFLPLGGYKGIGIAMLVQCLAGSLLSNSAKPESAPAESGAFLLVINPRLLASHYNDDLAAWLGVYTAAAPDARYPGQRAAECEARRRKEGIPITPALLAQFAELGSRLSIPFDPGR